MNICWLIIVGCLYIFTGCGRNDHLQAALNHAGDNRMEFEKVLLHYEDDTLKLRAAKFLIENMPYHFDGVEFMSKN